MTTVTKIQGVNPIVAMPFTPQGEVDFMSFRRLLPTFRTWVLTD